MNFQELQEAEAIHREEALRRIAALVKRYGITPAELLRIAEGAQSGAAGKVLPEAKRFDHFFFA
jgi:RecA-family ATPase